MYAALNYWENPHLKEVEKVFVGDEVIANISEFNITKGKAYKIVGIDDDAEITIENDKGIQDVYTVEYFDLKQS